MKIKLKGTLRMEQITVHTLLIIGILSFIASIVLEMGLIEIGTDKEPFSLLQSSFLTNVTLGLSASSMISYVSLIFQYRTSKKAQIYPVISALKIISKRYHYIYFLINFYAEKIGKDIYQQHTLSHEIFWQELSVLREVQGLEEMISNVIPNNYEASEFESKKVERLNHIIKKNISYNLSIIKIFCQVILPEEKIDGDKPDVWFCRGLGSISSLQKQTHEIISKGYRKDLYRLLLSTVESTYSIQEFESACEFLPNRIRGDYILPDWEDAFSDFRLDTDKMLLGTKIATDISKIRKRSSSLPE